MNLRLYRSFATELMKLAAPNAGVNALRALRQGKEYLEGGQLKTNDPKETNFMPKLAAFGMSNMAAVNMGNAADLYNLKAKTKAHGVYQNIRDYTIGGLKGAMTGVGVLGTANALRHGPDAKLISKGPFRAAAGIGAGLALADRFYRRNIAKGKQQEKDAAATPVPNPSATFTPARELHRVGEVAKMNRPRGLKGPSVPSPVGGLP